MPDIFGASGQFSIDALGAQNQNALNNAYGSGGFGGTVGQYAPYPMFGGPIDTGPAPSVFSQGSAPVPQQDLVARYWELMGGGGSRGGGGGGGGYTPPPVPQTSMPMPNAQGLLGYNPSAPIQNGFGYPGATPPSQMFNPSIYAPTSNNNDLVSRYYELMGMRSPPGLGGLGQSMQGPSPYNFDRALDQTPQNIFGHPGTLDRNTIDPNSAGWQYRANPRDSITQALMSQPQVAQGTS